MCASTRFPEAVPLCKIMASSVIRALTKFFSTFGLPRTVQTDQGTNVQSKLFKQVLQSFNMKHVVSSAYHRGHWSGGAKPCCVNIVLRQVKTGMRAIPLLYSQLVLRFQSSWACFWSYLPRTPKSAQRWVPLRGVYSEEQCIRLCVQFSWASASRPLARSQDKLLLAPNLKGKLSSTVLL